MTYLLRQIPDDLWVLVKRRAAAEGHSLRFIVLKLLEAYVRGGLPRPSQADAAWLSR
jgi:hypothetical protein